MPRTKAKLEVVPAEAPPTYDPSDAVPAAKAPKAMRRAEADGAIAIEAPHFGTIVVSIRGTAPYMQARFSAKARQALAANMLAGSTSKKGKKRTARDFDDDYRQAMYLSPDGRHGIPAAAFRRAMIDACRLVSFTMTMARLSLFVEADGLDTLEATPLVFIEGEPERTEMVVRNKTGVPDIRIRPMWRDWSAEVRVRFDQDLFTPTDVVNLMARVGMQVGIGEGRPNSKDGPGIGFGTFEVYNR